MHSYRKIQEIIEEKRCFESQLASQILTHPELFPAVDELSKKILYGLKKNKESLSKNPAFIKLIEAIEEELFDHAKFGIIDQELDYCHSPEKLLDKIIEILSKPLDDLALVMHIHQIFMQKIFELLPDKNLADSFTPSLSAKPTQSEIVAKELYDTKPSDYDAAWFSHKQRTAKKLFYNELFSPSTRVVTKKSGKISDIIGITLSPGECPDLLHTASHQTALDVFAQNPVSNWTTLTEQYHLPFISGPSGHVGSSLLLATLAGNFDRQKNLQYLTAAIGLITGGGYHTIHEILAVAEKAELVTPDFTSYDKFLPMTFQTSANYKKLAEKYPELLAPLVTSAATSSTIHFKFFNHVLYPAIDSITHYLKGVVGSSPSYFGPQQISPVLFQPPLPEPTRAIAPAEPVYLLATP